jgi:hypothetical protein
MSRSRSWWEIGVPLRYRGSHRPTGAYMGTRWRTRSRVPERRGRGTPTQVAKSGAILDIDEALRGLARSRLCVAGVRGGPSVSYRPSVAGLSIWGSSREHTCDLDRRERPIPNASPAPALTPKDASASLTRGLLLRPSDSGSAVEGAGPSPLLQVRDTRQSAAGIRPRRRW